MVSSGRRENIERLSRGLAIRLQRATRSHAQRCAAPTYRYINKVPERKIEKKMPPSLTFMAASSEAHSIRQPRNNISAQRSLLRLIDGFIFTSALMIYSTSRLLLVSFRNGGAVKNMRPDWRGHVSLLSCSAASKGNQGRTA